MVDIFHEQSPGEERVRIARIQLFYRFYHTCINGHDRLTESFNGKQDFIRIFYIGDDSPDSLHRTGHDAYFGAGGKQFGAWFENDPLFQDRINLAKLGDELFLVPDFNDCGDPARCIKRMVEVLVSGNTDIAGKQRQHGFPGFIVVLAPGDFCGHGQVVFDRLAHAIVCHRFFRAGLDVYDEPRVLGLGNGPLRKT